MEIKTTNYVRQLLIDHIYLLETSLSYLEKDGETRKYNEYNLLSCKNVLTKLDEWGEGDSELVKVINNMQKKINELENYKKRREQQDEDNCDYGKDTLG